MNLPRPQQCTAKFEDKVVYNEKFTQFAFEMTSPPRFNFLAGQYVSIKVSDKGERRSYSISSAPNIDHGFELLVDMEPNGIGVQYLANLQFGQEIQVLGPMGMFVVEDAPTEKSLVFIATGSGIAPMHSMLLDQLQTKQDKRPMVLYWGLRHEKDMFWELEFQELSTHFPNFTYHPVLSQPETDQWTLCRGRVTDCLVTHEHPTEAGYYICGNQKMLNDVVALLEAKGIEHKHIHHEKFY